MAKKAPNAAKQEVNDAADLLADAGRALYGEQQWRTLLARSLGVAPETLSAWMKGKMRLPPDHDVLRRTLKLLMARRDAADQVARRIAKLIEDAGR